MDKLKLNFITLWKLNDWGMYNRRDEAILWELTRRNSVESVLHVEHTTLKALIYRMLQLFRPSDKVLRNINLLHIKKGLSLKPVRLKDNMKYFIYSVVILYTGNSPFIKKMTNYLMNIQYHAINKYYCRAKKNIVIIAYPPSKYLSRAIMTIRHDLLIADFEDDTAERVDIKRRNEVIENYRKILPQCRWIFSTSPSLNEKYRNLAGQEIAYIPNGVDVNNFKAYHQHSYLKMKNQKTVGYIGIINREVDLDLLDYLLSCFKNISFFIIGYATEERLIDIKRLIAKYSNLHYLGYKCYKDIPDYISEFDVLINIKKPDHTTAGGESQKIYEYLLSGKPIVSTPVPPADRFSEIIYVAEDKYQFAENIKKALNEKNNDIKEKRKETALNNSWSKRTDDILFKIQSLLR